MNNRYCERRDYGSKVMMYGKSKFMIEIIFFFFFDLKSIFLRSTGFSRKIQSSVPNPHDVWYLLPDMIFGMPSLSPGKMEFPLVSFSYAYSSMYVRLQPWRRRDTFRCRLSKTSNSYF